MFSFLRRHRRVEFFLLTFFEAFRLGYFNFSPYLIFVILQAKKAKEEQEINVIPEENEDLNSSSCSSKTSEKESPEEEEEDEKVDADDIQEGEASEERQQVPEARSPRTPRVSECEKENNDPQQQQEEILSQAESDLLEDDDIEMPLYFARRHSLPVSSGGWKPHEQFKVVQQQTERKQQQQGWPVLPSVGRRHSLPTTRLLPITSFEKLTEKLFSVKEVSPTNASTAFEFDRWGTRIPHVSLNSSTLMNVSLEASKLTDAHGLNQVMLHQQRKYQSEPHVTQASTKSSAKLTQSPSANINSLRSVSPKTVSQHHEASEPKCLPNSSSNSTQSPHHHNNTFHSNHAVLASNCTGQRRSSLNSPQRNNNSVLPSNTVLPSSDSSILPRRASLGDKPRHNQLDTEAQPLLPKCPNSGGYAS